MQTVLCEGSGIAPVLRQPRGPVAGDGRADLPAGQPTPFEHVLSGMVGAGLVQEAICAFLTLTLETLSGQLVLFGLPMPSHRPMRKPCGLRPWTVAEVRILISRWCAGLHADVISRELDRSPGGVRSKARRLGLYRRRGRDLIKIMDHLPVASETSSAVSSETAMEAAEAGPSTAEPAPQDMATAVTNAATNAMNKAVEPTRRGASRIAWNGELDRKVAARWWAGQHHTGIARDLCMREAQVRSRANALGLPSRGRKTVPDYIEGRPYDTTLEESMVERYCAQGHMIFWCTRHGPRTSPKIMKTKGYKKLRSEPEEYHLHI